jgi:hypothetical protein
LGEHSRQDEPGDAGSALRAQRFRRPDHATQEGKKRLLVEHATAEKGVDHDRLQMGLAATLDANQEVTGKPTPLAGTPTRLATSQ